MASCGINEHHEGLRKQRIINRAAYAQKLLAEQKQFQLDADPTLPRCENPEPPAYTCKTGSPPCFSGPYKRSCEQGLNRQQMIDLPCHHGSTAIDRLLRQELRAQQLVTYSAKIPNRLSTINYTQQW